MPGLPITREGFIMAKVKGAESKSGWFRTLFQGRPDLLKKRGSNDEVISLWRAAHPGKDFSKSQRQAMANVKSSMKHAKRKVKQRMLPTADGGMVQAARATRPGSGGLEHLEAAIDRCLSTARGLEERDPDMNKVVRNLRLARNELVWMSGKS
jgi:hypothetical protein